MMRVDKTFVLFEPFYGCQFLGWTFFRGADGQLPRQSCTQYFVPATSYIFREGTPKETKSDDDSSSSSEEEFEHMAELLDHEMHYDEDSRDLDALD